MGMLHNIIETHGKQGALQLGEDRVLVEAASGSFTQAGVKRPYLTVAFQMIRFGKSARVQ